MENFDFIVFQKQRDFSEKLNVTFFFLRQNFKSLFKGLIFIAGPPILVSSLLLSSFAKQMFNFNAMRANPDAFRDMFLSTTFLTEIGLSVLFMVVSYGVIMATTYNYLLLYREKKTNVIELGELWDRVRASLGMYFLTMVLITITGTITLGIFLALPLAMMQASPFFGGLLMFLLLLFFYYLAVSESLIFIVRQFERAGFLTSLGRSFRLVQGKWWSTFGLVFVLSIVVAVVSWVFSIPASVLQAIDVLHATEGEYPGESSSTAVFVLNSLAYIAQLMLYFLPCLGLAFQYFNLVERKESKGLMEKIGTLGQPPPPPGPDQEQY